jgi:hypothetical protein
MVFKAQARPKQVLHETSYKGLCIKPDYWGRGGGEEGGALKYLDQLAVRLKL